MLRPYQESSLTEISQHFRQGRKKVLLWLATGGGKTVVFCEMIKRAHERGLNTVVIVRGRQLVKQASDRLFREKVNHGVYMAGHWNYRPNFPHQVASVDTLIARGDRPKADLVIVDEAHMATSKEYRRVLEYYSNAFIVAVTATPYVKGGLRHIADAIVHPVSMLQLVEQGYLAPFRYFSPSEPDLTGVKVSSMTKDYVTDQLEGAMCQGQLTGKIIDHWKQIASDCPTLCFAVNVRHSKFLVDKFLEAGVAAEHCDADTPDEERQQIIERLRSGRTKVVCNVGVLSTGVDIPCLRALIMARPTKSRNLFIQQAGRGTRTFEGKSNCILLDHAGNIGRHGLPSDEIGVDLDGKEKSESVRMESKICKACFAVYRGKLCPECGIEAPPAPTPLLEESEEKLRELTGIEQDPVLRTMNQLKREAREKGRKAAWVYYKLTDIFGLDACREHLPEWFIRQKTEGVFAGSPFRAVTKTASS